MMDVNSEWIDVYNTMLDGMGGRHGLVRVIVNRGLWMRYGCEFEVI